MYNNLFKTITPISSYWLGWLAADGFIGAYKYNNRSTKYCIGMDLQRRDEYILHKFANDLGYDADRVKHFPSYPRRTCFRVLSEELFNDLMRCGIKPRKTKIIDHSCIPNIYQNHFIRGLFDGDGSIYINQPYKAEFSITGHRSFLQSILDATDLVGKLYKADKDSYRIRTCHREGLIFNFYYMYDNNEINDYKLERKYEKFKQALIIKQPKAKKYTTYKRSKNNKRLESYTNKICANCYKLFECRSYSRQKYCSRLCATVGNESNRKFEIKIGNKYYTKSICTKCNKEFNRSARQVYCSKRCGSIKIENLYRLSSAKQYHYICINCNKEFYDKHYNRKYCCKKCFYHHRKYNSVNKSITPNIN